MNIKQAKEQVRKTCLAYLSKDEFGDYIVPVETQRPIYLFGAPGIGKTAIVAQVADELGLGLVDYSMTHHTRQSAIGLPYITQHNYGGAEVRVSEYTMSEIIASVYQCIEKTGRHEGILFLDEINCVSETLAPAMLRFLQSKTFGTCRVPDGWIVACAGNPVEYNRSAHNFDIVTLDRIKRIEIEPDLDAWRQWALNADTHPAVLSFLELFPDHFYHVQTKGLRQYFVTARAWSDLSNMMRLYERNDQSIDDELIVQYIQEPLIAADFTSYLDLFLSYARNYPLSDILSGNASDEVIKGAHEATFDERISLVGLLVDAMTAQAAKIYHKEQVLKIVHDVLVKISDTQDDQMAQLAELLNDHADLLVKKMEQDSAHLRHNLSARHIQNAAIHILRTQANNIKHGKKNELTFLLDTYNEKVAEHEKAARNTSDELDAVITFIANAFGQGAELICALTQMTTNTAISELISVYGCDAYFAMSDALMLEQRANRLNERLHALQL